MKKNQIIIISLLGLIILCVAALAVAYFAGFRPLARNQRPVVMIHEPAHQEWVEVDQGMIVYATARAQTGVSQIELWADGVLLERKQFADGENPASPMILSSNWKPRTIGAHVLTITAISARGIEGQASIALNAVAAQVLESDPPATEDNPAVSLEEDESAPGEDEATPIESAAGDGEPGEDEAASDEPGAGAGGTEGGGSEGDEGRVPSDDAPPSDLGDEDDAPIPQDFPPGTLSDLYFMAEAYVPFFSPPGVEDGPVNLQVEAMALFTETAYQSVHC
jgi:hypothetical protein